jgi:hypothetical protein
MSAAMASEKKKRGRPRPADKEPAVVLSVRMTQAHRAALAEAVARSRRTASVEMVVALEAHLTAQGLWPWPK